MNDEKLIKLQHFFAIDVEIKKRMYHIAPSNIENFDGSTMQKYTDEIDGYTQSADKAVSINEMLHFIHSYVVNNSFILQFLPVLNQKNNDFNHPIVLRGIKVSEFEQLFEQFPINLEVGCTDMVTISEKKLIMMVRDRGMLYPWNHLNKNAARIEYFIPKLCNIEMINMLPGINRVNNDSIGATGVVEVSIEDLSKTLFDFISKVPMDSDMIFQTGIKI